MRRSLFILLFVLVPFTNSLSYSQTPRKTPRKPPTSSSTTRKATGPTPQQLEAEKYFKQAEDLVGTASENSEQQIALFEKALALDPDLISAEFNLGVIHSRLRNHQKAVDHFSRALQKIPPDQPGAVNAHYMAAANLKALGKPAEARDHLQKALAVNPKHADALSLLGGIYLEEGKVDEAKGILEKSIQAETKVPEAFYNLALIAHKLGQTEDALRYYQKFVELMPDNAKAQLNLAILMAQHDRMQEAAKYARKAVELEPKNPEAWLELGKIDMLTDKQAEGEAAFLNATRLDPKWSDAHRLLLDSYMRQNKLAEANAVLLEAAKSNPGEAEVHTRTGELAMRAGDVIRALQSYGKAYELKPNPNTAFDFATAYARHGMEPLAEQYFNEALRMKPDFAEAWFNLGILKDRQKDTAEALNSYRKAEVNGLREGLLYYRLGFLYARSNQTEQALAYLGKAIQTDPTWKNRLREDLKAVTSDLDSIRYKPEFQKLLQ
ncbi:MAG TPA: tetratricopeptide repeat protein [Acidobacteriota bacterium]|jgi:superkiller protein 3